MPRRRASIVLKVDSSLSRTKTCVAEGCTALFDVRGLTELGAGCRWLIDWFHVANNPAFVYKEVACPAELVARSGMNGAAPSGACL